MGKRLIRSLSGQKLVPSPNFPSLQSSLIFLTQRLRICAGIGMRSNLSRENSAGTLLTSLSKTHGRTAKPWPSASCRIRIRTTSRVVSEIRARRATKPSHKDGSIWQPDFSDPFSLKYWGELVSEAGKRYDGHPYLDSVDISSVGYWGEGWSPHMPAFPYQKALIDIWFDAFPHTTLLMNFDEQQALTYGSSRGAGWRLDCLGDIRTKANDPYFPTGNVGHLSPASDTRRHSGCRAAAAGLARGVRYCFRMGERPFRGELHSGSGLRWHVTRVNLKSSPIPDDWKPGFESFQKKMGHRFLLRRLEYPKRVVAGSMLIHMWWLNSGVAPAYTNYPLAVQLR